MTDPLDEALAAHAEGREETEALRAAVTRRLAYLQRYAGRDCPRCGQTKSLSAFGPDARTPDGLRHSCRSCEADARRAARVV